MTSFCLKNNYGKYIIISFVKYCTLISCFEQSLSIGITLQIKIGHT